MIKPGAVTLAEHELIEDKHIRMKYGYTIADHADHIVFAELAEFVEKTLSYEKDSEAVYDVDGSVFQRFSSGENHIIIESDIETDYVALISNIQLPITCLAKWTVD